MDNKEKLFQIGTLSDLAKVSKRTIRYYQELGLISPSETTQGGFRLYTDRDLEKLQVIKGFKDLGFSLDEIKEIMLPKPKHNKDAMLSYSRQVINTQLGAIDTEIERLTQLRHRNEKALEMLQECEKCSKQVCPTDCVNKKAFL